MMEKKSYWVNPDLNYQPPELQSVNNDKFDTIVCEDFLDDPVAARNLLLGLEYHAPPDPERGVISFNGAIPESVLDEILDKSGGILGGNIKLHPRSKCAATYEKYPKNSVCHVDGGDNMRMFNWTLVIFMNLPEQCRGGTLLYKHKHTGHLYNKYGMGYYGDDFLKEDKWELVEEVEMKFNRAMFLPAWRFHSLSYTFGEVIDDARLTLNPKLIAF